MMVMVMMTMMKLKWSNLKATYCSPEGYFPDPAINVVIFLNKMRYWAKADFLDILKNCFLFFLQKTMKSKNSLNILHPLTGLSQLVEYFKFHFHFSAVSYTFKEAKIGHDHSS